MTFIPAGASANEFVEGMIVMGYMHYDEVRPREHTFRRIPNESSSRGSAYEVFKIQKSEQLINQLEKSSLLFDSVLSLTIAQIH